MLNAGHQLPTRISRALKGSRQMLHVSAAGPAEVSVGEAQPITQGPARQKAHTSALAIVLPYSAWPAIQKVRCRHDKSFVRWPPHINLLYPFYGDTDDAFETAAQCVWQALAQMPPFEICLEKLRWFEHGKHSSTLWLDPASEELLQLQAAIQAVFPECNDLSSDPGRGITYYTPHLSLGQWKGAAAAEQAAQEFAATWEPLHMQVQEVALLARQGYDAPFTLRYTVPIGAATGQAAYTQPQQLDVPYVSTMGVLPTSLPSTTTDRTRFGVGGTPTGIWNFSFGANMSPAKLSSVRELHPLDSKPALLRGYRLAFNHRGGFGNLLPQQAEQEAGGGGAASAAAPGGGVHGVLHRFSATDMGKLACMEHEYRPVEVEVYPYDGTGPVVAIAFVTPSDREIAEGLPTINRYLQLLIAGAEHWKLDPEYQSWLRSLPSIDGNARGSQYYSAVSGEPLAAWAKIRTGSVSRGGKQTGARGRGRGRGRQGGDGKGRGAGRGRTAAV